MTEKSPQDSQRNPSDTLQPYQQQTREKSALPFAACVGIVLSALSLCYVQEESVLGFLRENSLGAIFLDVAMIFAAAALAEVTWRAVLVLRYEAQQGCADELLPCCTVVVPAFNEGKQVLVTLQSLAASDYPEDRLKLVAVDDGSVDDTWAWISRAKELLGERVTAIRQPRNQGKRHALYAGFRQSGGEVLVTVDSDSVVAPDTIRNLVAPFVTDGKVGAVAGNVRVLNKQGLIPRMLEVAFVYSFDFIRASQSMVKAVMCTPGALSAYRRDVVMGLLQEWLRQTCCGRPANIGEDRALTNLIIREGYHVLFQQNAVVYTEVPTGYANLCKMYLRWARGDVRETIAMSRFIFGPFREGSRLGARINLISGWVAITKVQVFLLLTWGLILLHPLTFGINALLGVIISSSLGAALYAWKFGSFASLLAFVYGFYSFLSLSWIQPYALMTPHKTGWLTRQIKGDPAADHADTVISPSEIFLQEFEPAE